METIMRYVACCINEGLIHYSLLDASGKSVLVTYRPDFQAIVVLNRPIALPLYHRHILDIVLQTGERQLSSPELVASSENALRHLWDATPGTSKEAFKELLDSHNMAGLIREAARPRSALSMSSTLFEMEQYLREGHPTHPYHKERLGWSPNAGIKFLPEFCEPTVTMQFVLAKRQDCEVHGDFEERMREIFKFGKSDTHLPVPVHPMEIDPNDHVPGLSFEGAILASIRTIHIVSLCPWTEGSYDLKLSIGLTTTSSVRRISRFAIHNAPICSQILNDLLEKFRGLSACANNLAICREVSSALVRSKDGKAVKYSCIIRESAAKVAKEQFGAKVRAIPSMMLMEDFAAAIFVFLNVGEETFFAQYAKLLFSCTIPLLLGGFALEAHMQNMLFVIDREQKRLVGFCARDFGAVRVHPRSLDQPYPLKEGSAIIADSFLSCLQVAFHSAVHVHLTCVAHNLKIANCSMALLGAMRAALAELAAVEIFPAENRRAFFDYWFADKVSFKCFLRMKLAQQSSEVHTG